MIEYLVLGVVQGVTEWLPISSEGALVLVQTNFFHADVVGEMIRVALFFHLGTFLAALVYFRKEVFLIFKTLFHYKNASEQDKKLFGFLFVSTFISGLLGLVFLKIIDVEGGAILSSQHVITFLIGLLLLGTALLQLKSEKAQGRRKEKDLATADGIVLGVVQGFAAFPGFSRSGLTVSALLLRGFSGETSLVLSFLMSLPIVLLGNIILNFKETFLSIEALAGLLAAFVVGMVSIHGLLMFAKKVNFGYFTGIFAFLVIISSFF